MPPCGVPPRRSTSRAQRELLFLHPSAAAETSAQPQCRHGLRKPMKWQPPSDRERSRWTWWATTPISCPCSFLWSGLPSRLLQPRQLGDRGLLLLA